MQIFRQLLITSTFASINFTYASDPNPSARYGTKGNANVFLTAEALVFKFSQDAAPYAYSSETTNPNNVKTYAALDDYQWGFRVSGGYNISHDRWDLVLSYTRFHNSMSHTISDDLTSNLSAYYNNTYSQVAAFSDVTNTWKINYNLLDIEQGRQFFISKSLRIRPKFGLRNLWLSNSQTITAENFGDYLTTAKSNFWGMGVLAGLDTIWSLAKGFSLYGNVSVASLFGRNNPKTFVNNITKNTSLQYRAHQKATTKSSVDLAFGLRWDKNFSNDRFHVGFNLGFEEHMYFNMAQNFFSSAQFTENAGASGRDFALSGFAFGGRFDY